MPKASKYTYYPNAVVRDEMDGSEYTLGMTVESLSVEISGNTHPFYTGQEALVDTAGRIEKFQARVAAASKNNQKKKIVKTRKQKMTLTDLMKSEVLTEQKKNTSKKKVSSPKK